MKISGYKFLFKELIALCLLFSLLTGHAIAQNSSGETSKVVKEFDVNSDATVMIENKNGDIIIETWDKNTVEFIATITVKAKDKEDTQKVFDAFADIKAQGNKSMVDINTRFYESSQGSFGKSYKLKLSNGEKAEIRDYSINYVLTVPRTVKLNIESKYQNVLIPDMDGDAHLNIYDGKLTTGDFTGSVKIDLRYTNAYMKSLGKADIELYDSDFEMGDVKGELKFTGKYSSFEGGDCGELFIESYDDDISLGNVGNVEGSCRYANLTIENSGDIWMDIYDSYLKTGDAGDLKIKSKYSQFRIHSAGDVILNESYDDNFDIQTLNSLKCESKYSDFYLGTVNLNILAVSYDDTFDVTKVGPGFKEIDIKAKYTDISLTFSEDASYYLDANMVYPDFKYPEELFENDYYHKDGSDFQFKGHVKGSIADDAPRVVLDTYNCVVRLKHP